MSAINPNRGLYLADALQPDDTPKWLYRHLNTPEHLEQVKEYEARKKAAEQAKIAHLPTKGKDCSSLSHLGAELRNAPLWGIFYRRHTEVLAE